MCCSSRSRRVRSTVERQDVISDKPPSYESVQSSTKANLPSFTADGLIDDLTRAQQKLDDETAKYYAHLRKLYGCCAVPPPKVAMPPNSALPKEYLQAELAVKQYLGDVTAKENARLAFVDAKQEAKAARKDAVKAAKQAQKDAVRAAKQAEKDAVKAAKQARNAG